SPELVGGRVCRAGGTADRLAEERGDGMRAGFFETRVELAECAVTGGIHRDVQVWREVGLKWMLEGARAAGQGERRHRRAVIGLRRRDDAPSLALAAVDVVSPCEPQRRLVGLRAAGGKADARHLGRGGGDQPLGELLHRLVGEVVHVEVRDLLRLPSAGVDSGWNCNPRLRPETNACGPTLVSAMTFELGGGLNVSKCHWNHGPALTRCGSVVRTGSQPISAVSER